MSSGVSSTRESFKEAGVIYLVVGQDIREKGALIGYFLCVSNSMKDLK